MSFLKGSGGFNWNGNGKKDYFDRFMDMKVSGSSKADNTPNLSSYKQSNNEELKGITIAGRPFYDATKDSNGVTIFKCLLTTILCIGGIVLPVVAEMGTLGTFLSIFGGLGLSILILKNV
ncbi:MAG: hypothetical protein E7370_05275 [Clostridiales bacterium]|nr:hypothetical protein [Clostridiales bacterium]